MSADTAHMPPVILMWMRAIATCIRIQWHNPPLTQSMAFTFEFCCIQYYAGGMHSVKFTVLSMFVATSYAG